MYTGIAKCKLEGEGAADDVDKVDERGKEGLAIRGGEGGLVCMRMSRWLGKMGLGCSLRTRYNYR